VMVLTVVEGGMKKCRMFQLNRMRLLLRDLQTASAIKG
jgi:hypothetical protein